MSEYDVVIIGSGPGGYVCAIRCAQLGFKTAIVEKYPRLGGTCLNVGCIPSKAWLDSSERFWEIGHSAQVHGIKVTGATCDFAQMSKRVKKVVSITNQGVAFLMKKNHITVHQGVGSFVDAHTVKVVGEVEQVIGGKNIVIATGSKPAALPGIAIDGKRIISSTEALDLPALPQSLVVIGGGAIGLEMGSVFMRLGTRVRVVEYAEGILPIMDRALGKELLRVLKGQGMEFSLATQVQSVSVDGEQTRVVAQTQGGKSWEWQADYTLLAVGRRPYTEGLNLGAAGVAVDARGCIEVDEGLRSSTAHVYAIGDVVKGPMLAHKAEEDGVFVAERLAGQKPHLNYHLIPSVVYTWPEVAAVGFSEQQLQDRGVAYKVGQFPFKASGRARASEHHDSGWVKVLSDAGSDELLGVHMIGPRCADMIAEAVLALEYRASAEDLGRICHPHPTFSEALKEAALDAWDKRAIHI